MGIRRSARFNPFGPAIAQHSLPSIDLARLSSSRGKRPRLRAAPLSQRSSAVTATELSGYLRPSNSAPAPSAGPAVGSVMSGFLAISVCVVRISAATEAALRTAL
ncbi:hypothetical protein AWB82_05589 [Caballeronia glebae]|uniref:Uncharacterized protein n=1 Tax=Caballeronia glebae TaxID=1777143 RepID=A0A158CMH4_9BURK|nr:hypothetical protein AWB82_05589 [Caballeronia glebae]